MTKEEVLKIVDTCFHAYASFYRDDARQEAEDLINELNESKGQTLPIDSVVWRSEQLPDTCQDWVRKDGEKCIFTGMCQKCK